MFTPNSTWTHTRFSDVFVLVRKVQFRGPDYWEVNVDWWNRSQSGRSPWPLGVTQLIKIKREHLKDWVPYEVSL